MYNASKDSVIYTDSNLCFRSQKNPAISIASNNIIDRKDVQIYLWDRTLHLWWLEVQSCLNICTYGHHLPSDYFLLSLSLSLSLSQIETVLLSTHNICVGWDIKVRGKHSRFYLTDLFVSTLVNPPTTHAHRRSWSQILAWQTTQYFSTHFQTFFCLLVPPVDNCLK